MAASDEDIINIDKEGNCVVADMGKIEVRIGVRLNKPPCEEGRVQACIPCTRALSESIKRLMEFTDQTLRSLLNEPEWLVHVHVFLKDSI